MGSTDIVSSDNFPETIIPDFGKLPDHNCPIAWGSFGLGGSKDSWYVLQEDVLGSNLTDNSERVRPFVSGIISSTLFARNTEGGTRETCRNNVNHSSKLLTSEGRYVSEYWGIVEDAVVDPCFDDFLGVFFPFDISHRPCIYS
jgi:hypothetical protein